MLDLRADEWWWRAGWVVRRVSHIRKVCLSKMEEVPQGGNLGPKKGGVL